MAVEGPIGVVDQCLDGIGDIPDLLLDIVAAGQDQGHHLANAVDLHLAHPAHLDNILSHEKTMPLIVVKLIEHNFIFPLSNLFCLC